MEQVGKVTPDVVGVDGCKAGWVAVRLGSGGDKTKVFSDFTTLLTHYSDVDLILVDISIGLPEGSEGRSCDYQARKLLTPRGSCVFPTPTRQTAEQAHRCPKDYKAACQIELGLAGKKISQQAFNIAPKIAEVDHALRARGASATPFVREIHPEICFWALNGENCLRFGKKASSRKGYDERMAILRDFEPLTDTIAENASGKYLRKEVGWDDIADALVAAVTGYYGYAALQNLRENPPVCPKGLPMEMVYWVPPET